MQRSFIIFGSRQGIAFERLFSLISENLGPCGVVKLTPQGRMSENATPCLYTEMKALYE